MRRPQNSFLNPTPTPKIAHKDPKTSQMTPNSNQNQISELSETLKMKVVHMSRPQNSNRTLPKPKNSSLGPQKVKNDAKIEQKSNVRIERNEENESCSTT